LLVDDDPIFVSVATSCLSGAGFVVGTASDGAEALERIGTEIYDLAIIDLVMPRVDGFRLISFVRAHPVVKQLPIMVVTSRNDVAAVDEAWSLGADAFHTKPIDWTILPAQIRYVLRTAARFDELHREIERLRAS
jgi:DNA-binding response OmpR family regulator